MTDALRQLLLEAAERLDGHSQVDPLGAEIAKRLRAEAEGSDG